MKWRKQRIKLVSRVHPSDQMSEGCKLATKYRFNRLKSKSRKGDGIGKSVHYKTNPPPPKCFLPFLVSKKKNLQNIQLYTHKQGAGRNKNKLMGPSNR